MRRRSENVPADTASRAGGKLTFQGPARFKYELDAGGKIRLNADGTVSVAWWRRGEDGEWHPWMRNTFAPAG
jgi:hypothetical protein